MSATSTCTHRAFVSKENPPMDTAGQAGPALSTEQGSLWKQTCPPVKWPCSWGDRGAALEQGCAGGRGASRQMGAQVAAVSAHWGP